MPCYNVGRYITDCLDSIYGQGFQDDDFEVLAVNDCSSDNTRTVLEDYAKRHSNLRIIDHTCNLTPGGARNTGLDASTGDYVWFVDPDDTIVVNCAKLLYDTAREKDADVLFFNYFDCDECLVPKREDFTFKTSGILSGQEYVESFFPNKFSTFGIVWRALFKTRYLKENHLRYPIMRKSEDVVFLWRAMLAAQRVCSLDKACYLYRNNPFSLTKNQLEAHGAFSDRVLRGYEIAKTMNDGSIKISPIILADMMRAVRWASNSNSELLSQMSRQDRRNYYKEILNHGEAVDYLRPYMNTKSKLLFNVSGGELFWSLKTRVLCRIQRKGL